MKKIFHRIIKYFFLKWDPDYTKLTPLEYIKLKIAEHGKAISAEDIDWDI